MKTLSFPYLILIIFLNFLQNNCYIFSVIMAIHNTGRYLDESIGSLINQTIGYKEIQIILVNDGSTDNSEEICLKYQKLYLNNIIYIKIRNGGVSKARNVGLKLAKGEYINFLDSDDLWDSKAFEYILNFFKIHKNINFVSGRLKFFEDRNYYHFLDYKFYKTRIVNLTEEYKCIQSSSSTCFFRSSIISGKTFEVGVLTGEDTRFVNDILLINPIMGIIKEAIYFCRRRNDLTSRTQTQKNDVNFYFSSIKEVSQYLIDKSKLLHNAILPFIQFYLAYDILFRIEHLSYNYMNSEEYLKYLSLIKGILKNIEDKYILEQKIVDNRFIMVAISEKYNKDLRYDMLFEKCKLRYKKYVMIDFKKKRNIIIWKKIYINNNKLHLEGVDNLWIPKEKYYYYCEVGNKIFIPNIENYSYYNFNSLFGVIEKGKIIIFDIPLENVEKQVIFIYISFLKDYCEIITSLDYFTHLPSIEDGYFISGNFIIRMINNSFTIYKYSQEREEYFEQQYCKRLKQLGKENIIELRKKNLKYKRRIKSKIIKKEIWIVNDRKQQSGDNGEYFFRYLQKKNPAGIKVYFAIQKNCSDYLRLIKFGNILDMNSNKYLNMFLKSDKLISSVINNWVDNPFGKDQKYIRDLFNFSFIFIQNGIIKDDLSQSLNRLKRNIDLIVTSTKKEYNSIISASYGFNKNNILLTGMPRFDKLENYRKSWISKYNNKIILIIPTWRKYIKGNIDSLFFGEIYSDTFKYTLFFQFYNNLINDQRLIKAMLSYNYTGIFCLHHYFAAQWIDFNKNEQFIVKEECNYQELIEKSSLLITDYSSIFFDFAYLKKPIIYYQFDYHQYRSSQYPEGYFNYKRDGFGPVYSNINNVVNSIITLIKSNCTIKQEYLDRMIEFFTFSDENNSERLYKQLINKSNIKIYNFSLLCYSLFLFIIFIIFKIKLVKNLF